jgi:RES domain-containing protein
MIVYRVSRTKYANELSGEGARIYGGRWNSVGVPCIYTSENRALTVLEYSANVPLIDIPRSLSITTYQIPDASWEIYEEPDLPGNWKQSPIPMETMEFGSNLLNGMADLALKIPSAVLPQEYNYIINPLHPDMHQVEIVNIIDFVYDVRIKNV